MNIFACLVHEAPDCVADLVQNLRCLDPSSQILLYDGSAGGGLLDGVGLPRENVHVHPTPRPMRWGALHGFAIDCLRFASSELPFAALTIVDSDQLLLRPGYSRRLGEVLAAAPGAGCLVTAADPAVRPVGAGPAMEAWRERDAWRRYLGRFDRGEDLFPQWTFWPGTVFTAAGARGILALWDDPELAGLLAGTGISATEEVVLPTLVALSGAAVLPTPFRRDVVGFRRSYTAAELEVGARRDGTFWVHPAPRTMDDPVRRWVRERFGGYRYRPVGSGPAAVAGEPLVSCLLAAGDEPRLTTLAVRQFARQSYPRRELVVVVDDDAADDLVAGLPNVTWLPTRAPMSRVAKRNLAAAHARGQVFVHWDVDSWSAPTRLADQVRALIDEAADVCGTRTVLYHDARRRRAWRYAYPPHRRPWLAGASLCYRRELWEEAPFPDSAPEWQAGFYWPALARRVAASDVASALVVALPHDLEPDADAPGSPWERIPVEVVDRMMEQDAATDGGGR